MNSCLIVINFINNNFINGKLRGLFYLCTFFLTPSFLSRELSLFPHTVPPALTSTHAYERSMRAISWILTKNAKTYTRP